MLQPSFASLVLRFAVISALVLGGSYELRYVLIKPLIPVFREIIWIVSPEFTFYSIGIVQDGPSEMLKFRANLVAPIEYGGRTIDPIGWSDGLQGGYEVGYLLSGIFLYPGFLLIGVIAWPAKTMREFGLRMALTLPLLGFLLCVDTPSTTMAGLWNVIRNYYSVSAPVYSMVWSRFLMGGGGLAIAGALGLCAISVARWIDDPMRVRPQKTLKKETGYASFVIPKAPPVDAE
jgi:hypothetical protein